MNGGFACSLDSHAVSHAYRGLQPGLAFIIAFIPGMPRIEEAKPEIRPEESGHARGTAFSRSAHMYVCVIVCVWLCLCVHVCMYVCMYACMYVCMDGWWWLYVWMDGWMDVWMDVCMSLQLCYDFHLLLSWSRVRSSTQPNSGQLTSCTMLGIKHTCWHHASWATFEQVSTKLGLVNSTLQTNV